MRNIIVLLITLSALVVINALHLLRLHRQNNEVDVLGIMRSISTAQVQAQQAALINQDIDGSGEYLLLNELAGKIPIRTDFGFEQILDPPFISPKLSALKHAADYKGYYFQVFLPGNEGPLTDYGLFKTYIEKDPQVIDAQEKKYRLYAWPQSWHGTKVFFANEDVTAFSDNKINGSMVFYDMENTPEFNSATLSNDEDPSKFDGEVSFKEKSVSGLFWEKLD